MIKEADAGMAVKIADGPVLIGCDNQGAIKLIARGIVRQKSKHVDVKYHHIHNEEMKGSVKFQYVTSESNPADLLTKPLAVTRHEQLLQLTGLTKSDSHTENTNTIDETDHEKKEEKKGLRFSGEEKGVLAIRSWKEIKVFVEHVLASCRQA